MIWLLIAINDPDKRQIDDLIEENPRKISRKSIVSFMKEETIDDTPKKKFENSAN